MKEPNVKTKPAYPTREVILDRSKTKVTIPDDWHVSDTQAAQRQAKGDASKLTLALMQRLCLFNGERWTLDQIEENISGKDFLQLQGEFYSDGDGDAEKNE